MSNIWSGGMRNHIQVDYLLDSTLFSWEMENTLPSGHAMSRKYEEEASDSQLVLRVDDCYISCTVDKSLLGLEDGS